MATIAATRVLETYSPTTEGPYSVEYWRLASGGAAGDTCAITPATGRFVRAVSGGPFSNNLSTVASTNVTLTLIGGTDTQGAVDVRLLVSL